jgi:hypothetical protein
MAARTGLRSFICLFPGKVPLPGPLSALSEDNVTQKGSFRRVELFSHKLVFGA